MKKIWIIILIFITGSCGGNSSDNTVAERTLRDIVAENYDIGTVLIGATTGSWAFGQKQGMLLDRQFSYVTPENDFKQSTIRSNNNQEWNWERADAWKQHIIENDQILRMHCPIGPQCATWVKEDEITPSELEDELTLFLTAVCQRYNGTEGFIYMDVVNETVVNGSWHENKPGTDLWECPWFSIGQDTDNNETPLFIKLAFEIANEHASTLKFIYNHHEPPDKTASWDLIKSTVLYLRNNGLQVDGIGWQAHIDAGSELVAGKIQALQELIAWAHENDLEFHITEASVWLKEGNAESQLEMQADTYGAVLHALLEMRAGGVVGWNTWHVSDAFGWHTQWYPALFDENYLPKPAYYAIQEELERFHDR